LKENVRGEDMCLAIPAQVKTINENQGEVDLQGVIRHVSFMLVPEAKVGDWVLLHTGYALNIIDEEEAAETLKLFDELAQHYKKEDREAGGES
jgi:hydrogenase expression/formation protein HypC